MEVAGGVVALRSWVSQGICVSHLRSGKLRIRDLCFHSPVLWLKRYIGSSRHPENRKRDKHRVRENREENELVYDQVEILYRSSHRLNDSRMFYGGWYHSISIPFPHRRACNELHRGKVL